MMHNVVIFVTLVSEDDWTFYWSNSKIFFGSVKPIRFQFANQKKQKIKSLKFSRHVIIHPNNLSSERKPLEKIVGYTDIKVPLI